MPRQTIKGLTEELDEANQTIEILQVKLDSKKQERKQDQTKYDREIRELGGLLKTEQEKVLKYKDGVNQLDGYIEAGTCLFSDDTKLLNSMFYVDEGRPRVPYTQHERFLINLSQAVKNLK